VAILGAETLQRYSLGPKSTVSRALDDLVDDEILVRGTPSAGASSADSSAGQGSLYAFDDPFFRRWVQVNAAADLGRRSPPLTSAEPEGADPDVVGDAEGTGPP
jgi:hypothetical protein